MKLIKSLFLLSMILLITSSFVKDDKLENIEKDDVAKRSYTDILWESSGLVNTSISHKAFEYALDGYENLIDKKIIPYGRHLIIVDYSLPSDRERLVVYNVEENRTIYSSLVAHGRNSGNVMATSFSNTHSSYQSSLGFYLTAETYKGKHGHSLRLDGLEKDFNDNARDRAIVMHGAEYVTYNFIEQHTRLGRSLGCPSLPNHISSEIIDYIKEENVLFIYADNEDYLANSALLNS